MSSERMKQWMKDCEAQEMLYKYPHLPAWGHEYLYSWYEKIYQGRPLRICAMGDSTTYEKFWNQGGERSSMLARLLDRGGIQNYEIINCGYGSATTGHFAGTWEEDELKELLHPPCSRVRYPMGTLDADLLCGPDLLIISYGINDASTNLFPGECVGERLERFERNLKEALLRIRGMEPVNGRPAYGKSPEELAIILCVPLTTHTVSLCKTRDDWTRYTRRIIQELCREYCCGFYDIAMRHFDHEFSLNWSISPIEQGDSRDGIHPRAACNADFVSGMQDLLVPVCLWR